MSRMVATSLAVLLLVGATVRADDQADARAVIDKAIKAEGGADKLAKAKAVMAKMKGKVHVMGMDLDFNLTNWIEGANRMRLELDFEVMGNSIKMVQIFNKDKGWIVVNDMTMEMSKEIIEEAKEKLYVGEVGRLVGLGGKGFKLSPLGDVKIDGKEAVGIRVEHKGHRDVSLFFDKKTGLLVKTESREKDPQNNEEFNSETFTSGYKEVNGVQMPFKVITKRDGKPFVEAEVSEYKIETEFSDTLFAKP